MAEMGTDVITSNLTNPQRTYLWDVTIPNPIGGGDSNVLQARAQATSLPGRSVGTDILVPYKQTAGIKFPGKLTYSHAWQITFIEGEDTKVFAAIHAWNQQVINDRSGVSAGDENIKSNLFFTELSTKGAEGLKIKLIGCYPEAVADVEMSYATQEPKRLVVTFSFDSWEQI